MESTLPEEIANGAGLVGNEYGWDLSRFPDALTNAEMLHYACLGGQFQIRLESGVCESYWLNADSDDRQPGEEWGEYCKRSCTEVRQNFERLVLETDFSKQAAGWPHIREAMVRGFDLRQRLVFVAYFVDEAESLDLERRRKNEQASQLLKVRVVGVNRHFVEVGFCRRPGRSQLDESRFRGTDPLYDGGNSTLFSRKSL